MLPTIPKRPCITKSHALPPSTYQHLQDNALPRQANTHGSSLRHRVKTALKYKRFCHLNFLHCRLRRTIDLRWNTKLNTLTHSSRFPFCIGRIKQQTLAHWAHVTTALSCLKGAQTVGFRTVYIVTYPFRLFHIRVFGFHSLHSSRIPHFLEVSYEQRFPPEGGKRAQ